MWLPVMIVLLIGIITGHNIAKNPDAENLVKKIENVLKK